MRWCVAFVLFAAAATPAAAQSTYVGASLVGDIGRFSRVDYDDDGFRRVVGGDVESDGEALGFNVKIGREIREGWGVEIEFARTGTFDGQTNFALPAVRPERLDLTVPCCDYRSERSHTMVAALAFVRQDIGDRIELSYLGGVSFYRVASEQEFIGPRILIFPPVVIPDIETISYNVAPAVGFESAFKFGAAAVTTGIRLQTVDGPGGRGWLIRPNAGMRWTF